MSEYPWEIVTSDTYRLKVEGGYLYQIQTARGISTSFVPDVDLQRYQAHLRDAYKKGWEEGQEELKRQYFPI